MKCLEIYGKPVPLHCVFHGIRFKVNGRLVVEMTTFFFLSGCASFQIPKDTGQLFRFSIVKSHNSVFRALRSTLR